MSVVNFRTCFLMFTEYHTEILRGLKIQWNKKKYDLYNIEILLKSDPFEINQILYKTIYNTVL